MRDPRNGLIVVLAVAAAFFAGAVLSRPEPAQAQQAGGAYGGNTVGANNKMIAATGSVGSGMSVMWVLDTESKRLLVYGTNSLGKNIELRAARNITWDLALEELNDDSQYKSEDLQRLAEKRRREGPAKPPEPKPADGK